MDRVQTVGIKLYLKHMFIKDTSIKKIPSCFKTSFGTPSIPQDLLFFSFRITVVISSCDISMLISLFSTYVFKDIPTRETINNQFFIYGLGCEKCIFLAIWCVCGGGGFNVQTGPILLSSYPLTHIYDNVK